MLIGQSIAALVTLAQAERLDTRLPQALRSDPGAPSNPYRNPRIVSRLLSCGIVVRRAPGELLLGHATGRHLWDIPKGVRDPEERSVDAALRELREETGLIVEADRLVDLGQHRYLPHKDLQLYMLDPPDPAIDIAPCKCTTFYRTRSGHHEVPEVDAYRWAQRDEVPHLCGKNMTRVLMSLDW